MSPERRRRCVDHVRAKFSVSERRACRVLGQSRRTQRYVPGPDPEEDNLTAEIRMLALKHPRYGHRRITACLKRSGWKVNRKRVLRIWREQGLKVPTRQRKKSRLWLEGGRSTRLTAERRNHVWCYDFAHERTEDGRPVRILTVTDEHTRMALAARAARSFTARDVIEVVGELMLAHGIPENIRSDNGPELTAKALRKWLSDNQVNTVYIKPGAPWENAFAESFISRVRDELLDREIFYTLKEAQVMLERFRVDYNTVRPHSALGYLTPLEAIGAAT